MERINEKDFVQKGQWKNTPRYFRFLTSQDGTTITVKGKGGESETYHHKYFETIVDGARERREKARNEVMPPSARDSQAI